MGRNVLAIFLGAIVAVFVVASVEFAGMQLVPLPEGVDVTSPEAMRASMHLLPTAAFLFVLLAWVLAALVGGYLAARIGCARPIWLTMTVAGLVLAMAIINLVQLPHPVWFVAATFLLIPAAGWTAARLAERSARRLPPPPAGM